MNVDNIKQGQVIKNYKEVCKLLDDKVMGGDSKKAQLKEWARYFRWHNQGYKFIIDEVYAEPKPKIDGRINNGGNNTKYEDLFDKVIINTLIDYGGFIEESYTGLMEYIFCFFTSEYSKLYEVGAKRFAEMNNIGVGVTQTYQQKMQTVISKALETSLERLAKQGIIEFEKKILIKNKDFTENYADQKMKTAISLVEQKVYDELTLKYREKYKDKKVTPFTRVTNPRINDQFKRKTTDYLDIYSYYNVYSIKLIDKNTRYIEDDPDELIRRFIKSVVENVKNTNKKNNGKKYKPYLYPKYQSQIDKLTRLLWKLPDDYRTETETNENLVFLFGNPETNQQANDDYADDSLFDLVNNSDIPF